MVSHPGLIEAAATSRRCGAPPYSGTRGV